MIVARTRAVAVKMDKAMFESYVGSRTTEFADKLDMKKRRRGKKKVTSWILVLECISFN